ncbi:alpha/beta hydrolase [Azorhizobium doebereinerae]|uniref:alpha/beta hydrolase n=1 Tax=Azorhizobium doebereinerae TaxID=281091 RepID=UPI00041D69BF|nr:alpha/beta hydrolase [Azorhizobium doebereinerae]
MAGLAAIGRVAGRKGAGLALAALALGLAACGPRPGALTPVAVGAPGASTVDILAATTRAPSDDPALVYTGERGSALSFTNIVVSIPPGRAVGSLQWPQGATADPAREFAVTSLAAVPRSGVLDWFKGHSTRKHRVLVFVHGFNTRFDAAVFRFAQIVHDTQADAAPVLFSWPSRGQVFDYLYDRESTNFSRNDLAYVLREAARSPAVSEVVVMAHSMGAWLTVESLRQMALQDGRIPAKISNVVLASPDLDIDVFRRQVAEMGPSRPPITIFVSRQDRALGVSRFVAGGVTRVGAVDLTQDATVAELESAKGITVIDLSALTNGDALNHSKFATSPEVVQLMATRLGSGQEIGDSGAPKGAEAAQAFGTAVGTVAAAPILIFTGGGGR